MKRLLYILTLISTVSCGSKHITEDEPAAVPSFFGDSTLTIISTNRPQGYEVKLFVTKDITLLNLKRGDSINQYISLLQIPFGMDTIFDSNQIGTKYYDINIPTEKEKLGRGIFFMDVNFDGKDELLIESPGYNRRYFQCYDLLTKVPGFLSPMSESPLNNIVEASYPESENIKTEFDYKNKTIHIYEQTGFGSSHEIWAEMVKDYDMTKLVTTKREEAHYEGNGMMRTTIYERIDGELTLVSDSVKNIMGD